MNFTTPEKIKFILGRRTMKIIQLAEKLNTTSQNIAGKMSRNNFCEKDLREIAEVLDCDLEITFTMRDTGEKL